MAPTGNSSPATTRLSRWLATETRGFVGGLVGGSIGGLIAFLSINYFSRLAVVAGPDAVSIANTYIVYTTFVIAAVALLLTIAGLIFTQHLAVQKEAHMAEAFSAFLTLVRSDNEKAGKLIEQIMDNPAVIDRLSELLSGKIEQEIAVWKAGADAKLLDAAQHAAAVNSLSKDLSESKSNPKDPSR